MDPGRAERFGRLEAYMPVAKFGICAAVALLSLGPSVAFAWGVGGGGVSIPGFGALWREPNPPGFSQGAKKNLNGDSAPRRSHKGKKKSWRDGNVPPSQNMRVRDLTAVHPNDLNP